MLEIKYSAGATPLDRDEAQGLIPSFINTQSELNKEGIIILPPGPIFVHKSSINHSLTYNSTFL